MHVSINRESLLKSLTKVQSIVEKRSTIPILEHVKIEIDKDNLTLTATDMDIAVTDTLPIANQVNFSFTTVAHTLYEIVRKIYDTDTIDIQIDNTSSVLLKAGKSRFSLPCLLAEEFPSFDMFFEGYKFTIERNLLYFLLNQTKHAMCLGEARYYLNGVYLHQVINANGDKVLRGVATDSHRLASAEVNLQLELDIGNLTGVIIPKKTVHELIKLLDSDSSIAEIEVLLNENRVLFNIGSTKLISKVIDASFPDYKEPLEALKVVNEKKLTVRVNELKRAIDLVNSVAEGKTKAVQLIVENSTLTVAVDNKVTNKSSAMQEIEAEFNAKERLEILLNSKYIMDCLTAIQGEMAEFSINNNVSGILISDPNDRRCSYILMPMQLNDAEI